MAKELKFNFKKMGYTGNSQPTQIDIPVPICRIFISYLFTILQELNYMPCMFKFKSQKVCYPTKSFQNLRIASPHNRYPDKSEQ